MENKKYPVSGAYESEPSRSHYFSWINSTNEGSTENQTLKNLEYFNWLFKEYGAKLDIYAWDAGNLDGADKTYGTFESEKFKKQYPHGFGVISKKAAESGIRLGIWGGPDGFGKTPDDAKKRIELMTSLCRDFNFELFKFDGVCGTLRRNKRKYFCEMMQNCRKYCPDLILLNHRLDFGSGNKYATTFLWEGRETYVDVFLVNEITALHNRAAIFYRGNVPGFKRLTDDHGVCISSSIDYFEDDLIYQAFGRGLILSPSVYGNPWLMRDSEHAKLARIFNLQRENREILVNALDTSALFGFNSVSRGSSEKRFVVMGNGTWQPIVNTVKLNSEIGLFGEGNVKVILHHPYEKLLGTFSYGDRVDVEVPQFRAVLLEVAFENCASYCLENCTYEVIHGKDGNLSEVKVVASNGGEILFGSKKYALGVFDNTEKAPVFASELKECELPENAEALYEATAFSADSDSLEMRSLRRAGETKIKAVKEARDAFFSQPGYYLRGCDSDIVFDGNKNSVYDTKSVYYEGGLRINGGCLRLSLEESVCGEYLEIEYFKADSEREEVRIIDAPESGTFSSDLSLWNKAPLKSLERLSDDENEIVVHKVHNTVKISGSRMRAVYALGKKMKYFRLPCPMDRIYSVRIFDKDKNEIKLSGARVSNLLSDYSRVTAKTAYCGEFTVEKSDRKRFIAVAVNAVCGNEGVYCMAMCDGVIYGAPERAPAYRSNVFEHLVARVDKNYTYYIPIDEAMTGKKVKVYALFNGKIKDNSGIFAYVCERHGELDGKMLKV